MKKNPEGKEGACCTRKDVRYIEILCGDGVDSATKSALAVTCSRRPRKRASMLLYSWKSSTSSMKEPTITMAGVVRCQEIQSSVLSVLQRGKETLERYNMSGKG